MLTIIVGGEDAFDEAKQEFVTRGGFPLQLEHSLASLSKWESKFEIPFLSMEDKTDEQMRYYIECMIISPDFPPEVFDQLNQENIDQIQVYINSKQSATWFSEVPGAPRSRETITAELVYYWMTLFNIPFECQYWHLNKLFTFIKVCNLKNAKPKTMSRNEIAERNRELNAQRRAQLGTKG